MDRIIAPLAALQQVLRLITVEGRGSTDWPVGRSVRGDTEELILASSGAGTGRSLRVVLTDDLSPPRWLSDAHAGALLIGRHRHRGQAAAYLRGAAGGIRRTRELRIVGPGMHTILLAGRSSALDQLQKEVDPRVAERWSRTVGVLGSAWDRLVGLHFGIVGAGRTGSVLARLLLRVGVRRLTLVDPDVLARFNLGESDDCLSDDDVARSKVGALADALRRIYPHARILSVSESISHIRSLSTVKACDLLICCTDHDSARLATACLASLYCRPLVDVATGIPRESERTMGASVRLTLPGRCLLCTGGLRADAASVLRSTDAERVFHASRDWRQERLGSLASLNHLAAALAQRMIEDLVAERLRETTWLQVEYDRHGRITTSYPPRAPDSIPRECRLCATLTCRGDDGLAQVPSLIQGIVSQGVPPQV